MHLHKCKLRVGLQRSHEVPVAAGVRQSPQQGLEVGLTAKPEAKQKGVEVGEQEPCPSLMWAP